MVDSSDNATRATAAVPLVGPTLAEVEQQWEAAAGAGADLIEWRLDLLAPDQRVLAPIGDLGRRLKEQFGIPVLATWRTSGEGGQLHLTGRSMTTYTELVADVATWADAVDIEIERPEAEALISALTERVQTVSSYHRFEAPVDGEIIRAKLEQMEHAGASVAKVAWMIDTDSDLEALLSAQDWAFAELSIPSVIIGMGARGISSRLGQRAALSAFAFAVVGQPSAPGQPTLQELRDSTAV